MIRTAFTRTVRRSVRRTLLLAFLAAMPAWFVLAVPAHAQLPWLSPETGDLFHVSSAEGPSPGQFDVRFRRGMMESDELGKVLVNRFVAGYGMNSKFVFGLSVPHLAQRVNELYKDGLGDTELSLKAFVRPYPDMPIRVGLRQTLSLPTGYENERDGLQSFSSKHYDYTAQALFQFDSQRGEQAVSVYLNPGVILPGGDLDAYATAGLGLRFQKVIPLGFGGQAEYFTRYDLATEHYDAEVSLGLDHEILWGLGLEVGGRRKLLQTEAADPEMHLGIRYAWPGDEHDLLEVQSPKKPRAALLVHPIESRVPDPFAVGAAIAEAMRNHGNKGGKPLTVYVRSIGGEHLEAMASERHYELSVRLLDIEDGGIGGLSVPKLLRAPRAQTEIIAQMELIAPDGYTVVARSVLHGTAHRGLGVELAPASTSLESRITPDEVKEALRTEAAHDLATQILTLALTTIDARDKP